MFEARGVANFGTRCIYSAPMYDAAAAKNHYDVILFIGRTDRQTDMRHEAKVTVPS